jgi:hypothetical protein
MAYQLVSKPRIVTALLWTLASCMKVFSIVFVSYRANTKFRETVSEIRKLTLPSGLKPEIQDQLELFLIQLSNNRIEFTACGYFSVSFKLVTSLVNIVTTYLIVLLQVRSFN